MITVTAPSRYRVQKKWVQNTAQQILVSEGIPDSVVNIVFVGKTTMTKLATTYKGEKEALPVLAFPYKETVENESVLGDIVICYPQAVLLASERNRMVSSILTFLIHHAVTQLTGDIKTRYALPQVPTTTHS